MTGGAEFIAGAEKVKIDLGIERARKTQVVQGVAERATLLGLNPIDSKDITWWDRSLCAQADPDAFFPEKGDSTKDAKRICNSCESRVACLDYALKTNERYGVWGGFSPRERVRFQKQGLSAQEAIDLEGQKRARRKTA